MKYLLGLLLFGVTSLNAQQGELLVYESFDYPVFNPLFCLDAGGEGFTGPWQRVTGDDAVIKAGGFLPDSLVEVRDNHAAVEFVRAGIRYDRSIEPIQDNGQTIWISIYQEFKPGANPNNVGNLTFNRNGNKVFTIGRKFGNQRFGIVWPGATGYNSDVLTEGKHWVVVKLSFSGDNGPERTWMWIDPPLLGPEPLESEADLAVPQPGQPNLQLNQGFNGVQLKNEGTPPLLMRFDELKIGDSWAAMQPVLLPTSMSMISRDDEHIKVYPNPSGSWVNVSIEAQQAGNFNARLLDINGRIPQQFAPQKLIIGKQEISLTLDNTLVNGNYILQVLTDRSRHAERLVVIR